MRAALVFGAGATLANALHFHGQRMTSKNPPLDRTFFETARALSVLPPRELRLYAADLPTGSPFSDAPNTRIEDFFKDIFYDFLSAASSSSPTARAYEQLVDIYRRVISDTTDWLGDDTRRGAPVGRLIAAASERCERVTLMTFNQDLVLENEVAKRKRLAPLWCIDHGYGTFSATHDVTRTNAPRLFASHSPRCDGGLRLRILKLHGSLNWYVRMNGKHPSPSVLAGRSGNRTVHITQRRRVPQQLRFTKRAAGGRGRSAWYTWPVIIPPIYNKQALIQTFLPEVWADAREELAECDKVVFFGYSLPPADIEAEKLFQRVLAQNESVKTIELINPDPASAERFARLLPTKALH